MRKFITILLQKLASVILFKLSKSYVGKFPQIAIFSFDEIGHHVNLYGRYEKDDLELISKYLNFKLSDTSVMFDIGANIGNHSLYFSSYFNKVHSFEPNPRTFELLSHNAKLVSNIECHNIALSSKDDLLNMQIERNNWGASKISKEGTVKINAFKLDNLGIDCSSLKLLKIDVEGHELEVLLGSETILQTFYPIILFEQNPEFFSSGSSQCIDYLRQIGYRKFSIINEEFIFKYFNNKYLQYINYLLSFLFGVYKRNIKEVSYFPKKSYSMIIAERN
jgi:FkbM family methyltransferase